MGAKPPPKRGVGVKPPSLDYILLCWKVRFGEFRKVIFRKGECVGQSPPPKRGAGGKAPSLDYILLWWEKVRLEMVFCVS